MMLNPIDTIAQLTKLDKETARVLLAGLGVAAAVPILRSWNVNPWTSLGIVAFVVGSAILLHVVAIVFSQDPAFRLHRIVLGWLLVVMITLPIVTLFTSAVLGSASPFNPVYCQVQFWRNCNDVEEEIANQRAARRAQQGSMPSFGLFGQAMAAMPAWTGPSHPLVWMAQERAPANGEPGQLRAGRMVWVKFAGLIDRERMQALSRELVAQGWMVPQAEGGGERTQRAAGVNEIRFGDDRDRAAAELLARNVNAITPGIRPTMVRQDPRLPQGRLEVWVSR